MFADRKNSIYSYILQWTSDKFSKRQKGGINMKSKRKIIVSADEGYSQLGYKVVGDSCE